MNTENSQGKVLGNTASVVFLALRGKQVEGKVDTGATTSSLHAEDMQISKSVGQKHVRFKCSALSDNYIQLDMDGAQEVHSADGGGTTRPIVNMDIEIDGVLIRGAAFNLNDRSNMDTPVLIGQNILQAGNFTIDPNKDGQQDPEASIDRSSDAMTRESAVMRAIEVLAENDVSLNEIITYLHTVAVNRIKD